MHYTQGLPLSFQVTLKNPATILGFIQQSRQDTFYHPEVCATTLCSYARMLGYTIR